MFAAIGKRDVIVIPISLPTTVFIYLGSRVTGHPLVVARTTMPKPNIIAVKYSKYYTYK